MATGIGKGRTITCNACGMSGLRWDRAYIESTRTAQNPNGTIRMWNPATGEIHACDSWRKRLSRYPDGLQPVNRNSYSSDEDDSEYPNGNSQNATEAIENAIGNSGITRTEVERLIRQATSLMHDAFQKADASLKNQIDTSQSVILTELARLEKEISANRKLEIVSPKGENRVISRQHRLFPDLLAYANLKFNVLMVGPAGGGKTTASEKIAEAMNLPFYLFPMGPAITESRLLGWIDANGKYVSTMFRQAYEFGGIFMADEMDNANASALTTLNGALANGVVGFPDKMVKRHPDFIFLGGANTYGRGADRMYVGRQQLDAATLDRFLVIDWDYDEEFELYLAGEDQREWVKYVQKIRGIAFTNKLRVVVSPRASIDGAKLLRNGVKRSNVEAVRLWSAMPADALTTIKSNMRYS